MHKIIVYTLIVIAAVGVLANGAYCIDKADTRFNYDAKGRRDPFCPLIGQERGSGAGLESVASLDDLRLEGIAVGAHGRHVAIINGQMVKENDRFGALSIKKITARSVELAIEDRNYTLNLQEPEKGNAVGKKR